MGLCDILEASVPCASQQENTAISQNATAARLVWASLILCELAQINFHINLLKAVNMVLGDSVNYNNSTFVLITGTHQKGFCSNTNPFYSM